MFESLLLKSVFRLPREESCQLYIPLLKDTLPYINKGVGVVTNHGVIKQSEGHYFYSLAHLSLPTDMNIVSEFTMGGWFKRVGDVDMGYHIMFGDGRAEISISPNFALRGGVYVDNTRYVNNFGAGLVSTSKWTHLTLVYKRGVGTRAYINGIDQGLFPIPIGTLTTPIARKIGEYNSSNYGSNCYYRGMFIYNVALSSDDINNVMNIS